MRAPARRAWRAIHRWLGLALAAWLVLLGITGGLLAFYVELEGLLDARVAPRPAHAAVSIETVVRALEAAHPQRREGWRIELPAPGEALVTVRYLRPAETADRPFAPLLVSVDAATGEVLASRFWGATPGTWLYELHYALLAGWPGRRAVAIAGVALALSLGTGLALWWPARGRLREALRFKRAASAQRRVYDLHKWAGLAGAPLLAVLAATGSVMAWPALYAPAIAAVADATAWPEPRSDSAPGERLSADAVLGEARARWPQATPRWLDVPGDDPGAPYRVRMRLPGEPGRRFPASYAWFDARSGALLATRMPADFGAGDTLHQWLHPLHSGEAAGLAGRIAVAAAGVPPLVLAVTGWLRWRQRRRAAGRPPRRQAA